MRTATFIIVNKASSCIDILASILIIILTYNTSKINTFFITAYGLSRTSEFV